MLLPRISMRQREALDGYLFVCIGAVGFFGLVLGPVIASLVMSFTSWSVLAAPKFIGLNNYRDLIQDELFWVSLRVTSTYVATSVPLGMAWAFAIAILMNQKVKLVSLWRTLYYMPAVVSGVVMSLLWMWVFSPEWGIVNDLLARIGIKGPGWLLDSQWALPTLILMSMWTAGGSMVIYLAGLQGVPTALYEAASIDGANAVQRFWHVTVPMMSPVLLFQLVMGIIGSFQVFTPARVATNGGPANATLFYNFYLYRNAFSFQKMGYASALAWILFLIMLVCTLIVMRQSQSWVYYEGGTPR